MRQTVAINLNRDRNTSLGLFDGQLFTPIANVTVNGPYSITITTSAPYAPMLNNLAHPSGGIVSPAALAEYNQSVGAHPVGSGPFMVSSITASEVDLVRNPYYWGNTTNVSEIKLLYVSDAATELSMLQSGQAQIIWEVTPTEIPSINSTAGLKLILAPSEQEQFIGLDFYFTPFQNILVRQALNYAVNKSALISAVYDGYATVATSPVAPYTTGYDNLSLVYNYNVTKAKELLAEAGYPNGFNVTLFSPNTEIPETISGLWQQCSLK